MTTFIRFEAIAAVEDSEAESFLVAKDENPDEWQGEAFSRFASEGFPMVAVLSIDTDGISIYNGER